MGLGEGFISGMDMALRQQQINQQKRQFDAEMALRQQEAARAAATRRAEIAERAYQRQYDEILKGGSHSVANAIGRAIAKESDIDPNLMPVWSKPDEFGRYNVSRGGGGKKPLGQWDQGGLQIVNPREDSMRKAAATALAISAFGAEEPNIGAMREASSAIDSAGVDQKALEKIIQIQTNAKSRALAAQAGLEGRKAIAGGMIVAAKVGAATRPDQLTVILNNLQQRQAQIEAAKAAAGGKTTVQVKNDPVMGATRTETVTKPTGGIDTAALDAEAAANAGLISSIRTQLDKIGLATNPEAERVGGNQPVTKKKPGAKKRPSSKPAGEKKEW